MNYMFKAERYALKNCDIHIESLFKNDVHKETGKYFFPFHKHDNLLEISIILAGQEEIEFKSEKYLVGPGTLIVKNAGELHQERGIEDSGLEEISIGVSGIKIEGLRENCFISDDFLPIIDVSEEVVLLHELFLAMRKLLSESIITNIEVVNLMMKTFLATVLLLIDNRGQSKEKRKGQKLSKQIAEILDYIHANYTQQISLDDIAKTFYISPYYLSRRFKSEVGYSVNQYIQNLRLGKAEQRLVFEKTPIKEIATECGYPNVKHFYSIFKLKTGHAPMEFRQMIRLDSDGNDE